MHGLGGILGGLGTFGWAKQKMTHLNHPQIGVHKLSNVVKLKFDTNDNEQCCLASLAAAAAAKNGAK